jgi:ATP-dependent DNA helicase RecG
MDTKLLFAPVTQMKGVGTKTAANLASLGIYSIYDLLFYFPFRYDELTILPLAQLQDGQKTVLKGKVATAPYLSHFGYRRSLLSFKLKIDHDIVMVNFFNQPWLAKQINLDQELAVYGKYERNRQSLTAFKLLTIKKADSGLAAVYPVNKQIRQKTLVKLIKQALAEYGPALENIVPAALIAKFKLVPEPDLIYQMHQPKNKQQADWAKRTAIFREFFIFQMQLALLSQQPQHKIGLAKKYDAQVLGSLTDSLSFKLSSDQKQVIKEILADLSSSKQMRRLLQGDVGSGKTVVAVYAILAAITAGYQVSLMVPTEILAVQHFQKIDQLLQPLGIRTALLLGNTKKLEKREIYRELANGTINVVIGTHALIQKDVIFKKLGLAIIDEQHRFGVGQRQALLNKGKAVDLLAMTATPIPRTLALTVYGDMSISEIHHLPAGRKPIKSAWVTSSQLDQVYARMRQQLAAGFQIYAVTPLISESEKLDLKNAQATYEQLLQAFPQAKVVLLHGQMASQQKEEIMAAFAAGEIDILVTTSVIEVGVDVARANMMVIFDADRFGLSQLHQLRGRIGRGQTESYCYFLADPKTENGKDRMRIIAATSDGFKLAEEDLKMRGQGDLFGHAQSGLPVFKVGNVVRDYRTLRAAQQVARELVQADPQLKAPDHQNLREVLKYKEIAQGR